MDKRTRKHRKQQRERKVREMKSAVSNQITRGSFRNVPLSLGPKALIVIRATPKRNKPRLIKILYQVTEYYI